MSPGQRRRRSAKRRRRKATGTWRSGPAYAARRVALRSREILASPKAHAALVSAWQHIVGAPLRAASPTYMQAPGLVAPMPATPHIPIGLVLGPRDVHAGPVPAFGAAGYDLALAAPELVAVLIAGRITPPWPIMEVAAAVNDRVDLTRAEQGTYAWVVMFDNADDPKAPRAGIVVAKWDALRGFAARTMPLSGRMMLPLSVNTPIFPGQSAQITARPQQAFRPERMFISSGGGVGSASDWLVRDVKIGNRSQFAMTGDIPGDMFSTYAINSYVLFETAQPTMDIVVVVTYVGPNPLGALFYGALVGTSIGDAPPEHTLEPCATIAAAIAAAPAHLRARLAAELGMPALAVAG